MKLPTYKLIAQDFLLLTSKGQARKAFKQYVGEGFKHHNAFFKGDAESLIIAMEEDAKQTPFKVLDIKRILLDGDLVAVHSHIKQNPKDPGAAVIHIFRFKNDKIVELWDVGQAVPPNTINENGMF